MGYQFRYFAAAIIAASIACPALATYAIPITGTTRNQAYAFENEHAFEDNGSAVVKNEAWLLIPTDLASSAAAIHFPDDGGFEGVSQDVSAVWSSPDSGSVTFKFQSFIINSADLNLDSGNSGVTPDEGLVYSRWTYRFIASADSLLKINLSANSDYTGPENSDLDEFNSGILFVNGDGAAGVQIWPQQNSLFDTDSYSLELNAGEEYFLEFQSDISLTDPIGTSVFNASQTLTFSITDRPIGGPGNSLPEPTSWATLIAGFALAGGALRRRRPALPKCARAC